MGIFFRKSVSVGPFRFNLSGGGVGMSVGVKGLRVGTGPRGNYIHMGRNGLYYRATLPSHNGPAPAQSTPQRMPSLPPPSPGLGAGPMEDLRTITAGEMAASSQDDLLREIQTKAKKVRMLPLALWGSAILLVGLGISSEAGMGLLITLACLCAAAILAAWHFDKIRKTTVLVYDLDDQVLLDFGNLLNAGSQMASCSRKWSIAAQGKVYDAKYHAGASKLINRKLAEIKVGQAPFLASNVDPLMITAHNRRIWCYPDRILISDSTGISFIRYEDLSVQAHNTRFIEEAGVPHDSKIVDRTWRYVNKNGGPDRRFNNNRELPVCLYEEVTLSFHDTPICVLQLSATGKSEALAQAASTMGRAIQVLSRIDPSLPEAAPA